MLTKQEAIDAMKAGKKVAHKYFFDDEWMTMKEGLIVFEDEVKVTPEKFWSERLTPGWNDGYWIINP